MVERISMWRVNLQHVNMLGSMLTCRMLTCGVLACGMLTRRMLTCRMLACGSPHVSMRPGHVNTLHVGFIFTWQEMHGTSMHDCDDPERCKLILAALDFCET